MTKFCRKCRCDTVRQANGRCKPCDQNYKKAALAANPDKARASCLAWRTANPVKMRAASAAWSSANPESRRIFAQNRRARKRSSVGKLSNGLTQRLLKLQRGKCACCGGNITEENQLDHVVPLALGGPNEDWNMQLLCPLCNQQKHVKHPIDFMQSKGFLL